jgi:membrane-associated protein
VFLVAAFLGNVTGYEIGRLVGPRLYQRDSRILKSRHLDNTHAFFDPHGNRAIVIGRPVPFIRTYATPVAGVGRMERRRFLIWSGVGALAWVASITVLGYVLGNTISRP